LYQGKRAALRQAKLWLPEHNRTERERSMGLRTHLAAALAAAAVGVALLAPAAAEASPQGLAAPAAATATVPKWLPYMTEYDNNGVQWTDYSVNLSAKTSQEIAVITSKALAKKIRTVAKFVAFRATQLETYGLTHHDIGVIVIIVGSVAGLLTFRKFSKALASFILWAKGKFRAREPSLACGSTTSVT
jgi:hypothetical protein